MTMLQDRFESTLPVIILQINLSRVHLTRVREGLQGVCEFVISSKYLGLSSLTCKNLWESLL